MTLNCNEHCRHCGSRCGDLRMENQLSDQEIIGFLSELKTKVTTLPFLNITGGEPTLRPDFIELMHEISELGYNWGMTTNGILIDEKVVEKMVETNMKTISVSIDGLEELHESFRRVPGSFKKIIKGLKLMQNCPYISLEQTGLLLQYANIL